MAFVPVTPQTIGAAGRAARHRAVGLWLLMVAAAVFAMVVIGGVTRLTESGLSIVEWRPVAGTLPPMSETAWAAEFEKYQASPQYRQINLGMTLDEFKNIFWWEYIHRLWGRLIGVVFALPLLIFALRGWIERDWVPRLFGLFVLGGAQGALGWYMVASGLIDRPSVSHYRLAAHLGLAVVIFGALLWSGWHFRALDARPRPTSRALVLTWVFVGLVFLQMMLGALVAGLRAGLTYNTWPLMDGRFFPSDAFLMHPWWLNFLEHIPLVQFQHRLVAYIVLAGAFLVAWRAVVAGGERLRVAATALVVAALAQVAIGILTLVYVVPVGLGALHQAGALVVLTAALWLAFRLRYPAEG